MRWLTMVMLAACTLLSPPVQDPAPIQRLTAEMDRARADLAAAADRDRAAPLARLDRAKAALDAGRTLLALYLLEAPWEAGKSWSFVKASGGATTPELFAKKWADTGEPRSISPAASNRARRPALVDAMAASAEARGPTTYHASRFYGEDAGVPAGLYYLGDSHAVMQFAALARSIDWTPAGTAPPLRSIGNEIGALDIEMTTAYESMDRADHSSYIVSSAALKQARILDERGQFGGALFQYLLSRYLFAPLRGPAAQDATAARIAGSRASLDARVDNSIAELFLQLAEEGIAGSEPARRRGAAAAIEDVIPAYLRAIAAPSSTTASAASAPAAQVTITLVRWPFT
jgi:hypothetical protein